MPVKAKAPQTSSTVLTLNINDLYEEPVKVVSLPEVKQPEIVVPPIMVRIRNCESGGNYQAQNSRSTASGAYQFIDGTWNNYKGYAKAKLAPEYIQDEYAVLIYNKSGTRPWNASINCWGQKVSVRRNLTVNSSVYYSERNSLAYNCVTYARSIGANVPSGYGYARNLPIQTKTPYVGATIVTYESSAGHVGMVIAVENGVVHIQDGNYRRGYATKRTLPITSGLIKGYI